MSSGVDVQFCKGFLQTNFLNVFCTDKNGSKILKSSSDRFIMQFNQYYKKGLMVRVNGQERGIPVSYFEIFVQHVSVDKPIFGLGLAKPNYDRGMVGWNDESIGYHADDGYVFHNVGNKQNPENFIGGFSLGDTAGLLTVGSKVYFTKNGVACNKAFELKNFGQEQYIPTLSSSYADTTIKIITPDAFKCDIYKFMREVLKLDLLENMIPPKSMNDYGSEMMDHCDGLKKLILNVMQQESVNDSLQKEKDETIQKLKVEIAELQNNTEELKKQNEALLSENEKLKDLKNRFTVGKDQVKALTIEQLKEISRILLETQNTIHNKEKDLLDVELLCIVCQDRRKNTLFLPCKHLCVCEVCTKSLKSCPMCRKAIVDSIQTHL